MSLPVLRLPKRVYPKAPKLLPIMEQYPLYALEFPGGASDYVEASDSPSLDILDALSIGVWVYRIAASGDPVEELVKKDKNYLFRLAPDGTLRGMWWIAPTTRYNYSSSYSVGTGLWRYVGLVVPSDATQAKFYTNGSFVDISYTTTSDAQDLTNPLEIGGVAAGNEQLNGFMAVVHVYNRALSLYEFQRNMYNPLNPIREGLVLFFPMIEGYGSTVRDYSGYGNDGALHGGVSWVELMKYEIPAAAGL